MGCSCDYDHENFTMSPEFSKCVRKLFVDWYKQGIIYRGKRIVNWCPCCTTAIADDEAEYADEPGHLWYLKYPLAESVDGIDCVIVATTRPETMLGDTGVAVSPKDERYAKLVGKSIILPIVGREIPIFEDFYVDADFGTGAVKTTPAHDINDYAMGERHNLEKINIFDETAHVVEGYGRFSGMSRHEAREEIVKEFERQGLLDHVEDINHSVMHCYRCHTALEPWLSEQWFVDVDKVKQEAKRVVSDEEIKFFPSRWKQVYIDWIDNLKDWCISRQLWWGHRIPMYYCDKCGWMDASVDEIKTCPKCGASVRQDEDVLDTWFSSQLWPFATLGWASDDDSELKKYYPTQMLSTARDIMGLWVARMVMSSMYCTGQIPFQDVIIHPTVMGADGKPMSKSRGNGVNPVDLMDEFGADGMRFGLLSQVTGAQAVNFDERKIESARNFANKIRNAVRFTCMNLDGFTPGDFEIRSLCDKWIFSRLASLVLEVDSAFEAYDFAKYTSCLYQFFWNEFCDWYIEFAKPRLTEASDADDRLACQQNLVFILRESCKLLHPVMPFVTEEIYSMLFKDKDEKDMLIVADWPNSKDFEKFVDKKSERDMGLICDIIGAVRSIRAQYSIAPKVKFNTSIKVESEGRVKLVQSQESFIKFVAGVCDLEVSQDLQKPPSCATAVIEEAEIYVALQGIVDIEEEKKRLQKKLDNANHDREKFEKKLSNPGFLAKASEEIIQKDRAKLDELTVVCNRLETQLSSL